MSALHFLSSKSVLRTSFSEVNSFMLFSALAVIPLTEGRIFSGQTQSGVNFSYLRQLLQKEVAHCAMAK